MPGRSYPDFASEAEEADWLSEHRDELDLYFSPTSQSLEGLLARHGLRLPEASITVSLTADELALAKKMASAEGLDAQTFVGRVVHDALKDVPAVGASA